LKTPAPLSLTTPAPVTKAPAGTRDASSALPSIPAAKKEPSGAFPLPGMASGGTKSSDEDVTLIARLSLLDELVEESTKVEPIDAALRAAAKNDEPLALADQALAERDRALGLSPAERMAAAEFEDPGDDDELTVSATPGIISISDEEDDDDEPTASQRPQNARKTPTPTTAGLQTPLPSFGGGPRLPAPSPPPGRPMRLPTPSAGMSSVPMPLATPASAASRSLTPALPIPAPMGSLAGPAPGRSAIFSKVQLPIGGLVASLIAMFGIGLLLGAVFWRGQAATIATEPPPPAPIVVAKPEPEPAPPPVAAPAPTAAAPAPAPEPTAAEAKPAAAPEPAPVAEPTRPVKHLAVAHPKPVIAHKAATEPGASPKPVVAAAKPAAKPAKAMAAKSEKAKSKSWVDPFAE
jgi:hypothetical protein